MLGLLIGLLVFDFRGCCFVQEYLVPSNFWLIILSPINFLRNGTTFSVAGMKFLAVLAESGAADTLSSEYLISLFSQASRVTASLFVYLVSMLILVSKQAYS